MAVKPSPYKYLGNVAPVQKLNVPKPKAPVSVGGWDSDSISKAMNLGAGAPQLGTLGGGAVIPPAPAVTTPAKAAVPGRWITTDFNAMIPGDFEVTDAERLGVEAKGAAEAALQRSLRQAFIDFGGDASKLDERFRKYIDEPTIEAARTNKFSQIAQNLKASTRALANKRAQLGSRGLTFSGANTEATRRALEARELADYTAGRSFTGGAEEGLTGLANAGRTIEEKIAAARSSAAARLAAAFPNVWEPGQEAVAEIPAPAPVPQPASFPVRTKREEPWERALRLRSEAMNSRYGLG